MTATVSEKAKRRETGGEGEEVWELEGGTYTYKTCFDVMYATRE
jgi:hypothetical protein